MRREGCSGVHLPLGEGQDERDCPESKSISAVVTHRDKRSCEDALTAVVEKRKTAAIGVNACSALRIAGSFREWEEAAIMSHARSWYNPMSIIRSLILRPRVYTAALAGAVTLYVLPRELAQTVRATIAWDVGGFIYLIFAFQLMFTCHADRIKARAARRDDSRLVILTIVILAIISSFAAIAGLIGQAKLATTGANEKLLLAGLAALTIIVSWCVMQVAFALHYAHDYYMPNEGSDAGGGLIFPGCEVPDYWDFLYFSTSIGATSQTSDTSIRSRALRRLVTVHAAISFFFNTAVLALTVNIAASLPG